MNTIYILATMDAETVRSEVPAKVRHISVSGPESWEESERAIAGYADVCEKWNLPVSLFAHPEVAAAHADLLRELENSDACLGLHIHPYKLIGQTSPSGDIFDGDLGAYDRETQVLMIQEASERWAGSIGHVPRYFRGGYFSANDVTFGVLEDLGFVGGSLSNPGRILAEHQSVWAGAPDHPHRAHEAFRLCEGSTDFIEVPVSVDYERPVQKGAAGEAGYEWPYLAADYGHAQNARNIVTRFSKERPTLPVFVIDVHNDKDFHDRSSTVVRNLDIIMQTLEETASKASFEVHGVTIEEICRKAVTLHE